MALHLSPVPAGIVWSNGRIEAQEIDIDTKFPGRVAASYLSMKAIWSAPGKSVAIMDTRDLKRRSTRPRPKWQEAQRSLERRGPMSRNSKTQVTFAQQELDRTTALVRRGYATMNCSISAARP